MDLTLRPIGVVRSPYKTPLDAPRQGEFAHVEAVLEIHPEYAPGLAGIEAGADLLVVWWAHLADRALLAHPGTDGVFAMRTPHRPNPICVSEARVVRREGPAASRASEDPDAPASALRTRIVVTGLEATEGTPILDLKSARAEFDGWMGLPGVALE
jgi:formylmethanofuran dehydrogenase subunit E